MILPITPRPAHVHGRRRPSPPAVILRLFAPDIAPPPEPAPILSGETPWRVAMPGRDPWTFRARTWTTEAWARLAVHPAGAQLGADGIWVQLTID